MISKNNIISEIYLLRRREWWTWLTVWPFLLLYPLVFVLYINPGLLWDRMTYFVYSTYIDFFHATCIPVVIFFHGFLSLFTTWSVRFRSKILFCAVSKDHIKTATHVFVVTREHKGGSDIVPLFPPSDSHPTHFIFQERKWKLDASTGCFVKPHFPTKNALSTYLDWEGLNTPALRAQQLDSFGYNKMEVVIPDFKTIFVDHALAPFFVFQMFCVFLWCLDEYWYYSIFSGIMMVGMECTVVMQRIRNMRTLRDMAQVPVRDVIVLREGQEKVIKTTELLPLDILVVDSNAPCPVDTLLVRGTCIVNEATLTGESTPQLKEAPDHSDIKLEMKKHSRHLLYSGTQILLSNGPHAKSETERGRALAVVLKTGFETKQGKLLRTIIHSQGRVSENSGESFAFIGVLVIFALAAVGYLLKRGLADPTRSRWKLFLSCVQIITSVVPPELPMELSLAVNTSLIALVKLQVFCTEPFRIPFAGKVDTCCFDKTGTLTTDEMLFAGVDMADGKGLLNQLKKIPKFAELVLVTCHSLLQLEGTDTVAGDAMEKASVDALGYRVDLDDTVVYDPPAAKKNSSEEEKNDGKKNNNEKTNKNQKHKDDKNERFKIILRFPFSANLRRMSCVVSTQDGKCVVAKGSPEAIAQLCTEIPPEYHNIANAHASSGYRVIALAIRFLNENERSKTALHNLQREDCEKGLKFAGFAVYECPLKKDSKATISMLQNGSHRCVIITGDSVGTAISVGRDVGILQCGRQLVASGETTSGDDAVVWRDARTGESLASLDKSAIIEKTFVRTRKHMTPAEDEWDLCVNAENLSLRQIGEIIATYNEYIAVWARCAPTRKEDVVMDLKSKNHVVLMAGDGTNDVGALKQAHAGIAVLNAASVAPQVGDGKQSADNTPQSHNEPDIPAEYKIPPNFNLTVVPPRPQQDAPFMEQVRWRMVEARRKAEVAQVVRWNKQLEENRKKKSAELAAMPQVPADSASDFLTQSLFNVDDMDMGGAPQIKLGDASIAAPFTCRSKALMSVCDVVRLGRSTLVTTLQMYKILAVNCLVSAYSMSVLHTDGVKLGEKQMILAGVALSICFLCMSRCQPMHTLCPQRPITRVFHPYMIFSIFMQFALHLYSMMQTVALVEEVDSEGVAGMRKLGSEGEFKPNLLNSAMFLLTTLIGAVTFSVNYRGEPFMQSIRKNKPMFFALIFLSAAVLYFASEMDPDINALFEIVAFPSQEFRYRFLGLLLVDAGGAFVIEYASLFLLTDYM